MKVWYSSFPHGATVNDCEFIVQKVQSVIRASVSEGGMLTTNKYGMNVDDMTFSEDTMHYVYGYDKTPPKNAEESV